MGEWLVADVSVLNVHFQLWMLLAPGYAPVLVIFICAMRSVR
jgi:hypothetical protein